MEQIFCQRVTHTLASLSTAAARSSHLQLWEDILLPLMTLNQIRFSWKSTHTASSSCPSTFCKSAAIVTSHWSIPTIPVPIAHRCFFVVPIAVSACGCVHFHFNFFITSFPSLHRFSPSRMRFAMHLLKHHRHADNSHYSNDRKGRWPVGGDQVQGTVSRVHN